MKIAGTVTTVQRLVVGVLTSVDSDAMMDGT